jgi:hypothetical protein
MPLYATLQEAREFTNAKSSEYTDTAMNNFIMRATEEIDDITSRTWQEAVTETDVYFDGDGMDILYLDHTDLQTLTSISIRTTGGDSTATYTAVTTSKVAVYPEGYLILYSDAEVTNFTAGPKTVKLTYTHGAVYATAIDDVAGITAIATSITVDDTSYFPTSGIICIDTEWISYTGKTLTTFTGCTRGHLGTTAATHANNAVINEVAPDNIRQVCLLLIAYYMDGNIERKATARNILYNDIWKGPIIV